MGHFRLAFAVPLVALFAGCSEAELQSHLDSARDQADRGLAHAAGEALRAMLVGEVQYGVQRIDGDEVGEVRAAADRIPGSPRVEIVDANADGRVDDRRVTVLVGDRAVCVMLPSADGHGDVADGSCS